MKILIIFIGILVLAVPSTAQQFVWTQKNAPTFLSARYEPASFSIDGKIYIAGGSDNNLAYTHRSLWQYNPNTDTWAQKALMPPRGAYGCRAFVINQEAYVYTGWWRKGNNIKSALVNFKYSPASNSWSVVAAFPDNNRYTGVAFAINGKGYFGTGYSPLENDLWKYNPGTR